MKLFSIIFVFGISVLWAVEPIDKTHVLNVLKYYSQCKLANGGFGNYHTITIGDQVIHGQRKPLERLKNIPYDFTGKTIFDIGTNLGGMLFALADKIKYGVGIDYHTRAINFANRLKSFSKLSNVDFYTFDLDKEPLDMLANFLPEKKVDICFMLSMALWVKKWKQVADHAASISDTLLFETHGPIKFQEEQVNYLKSIYRQITRIRDNSNDDPGTTNRQLYLCYK
jgi:SAM-dependent methyltransferase